MRDPIGRLVSLIGENKLGRLVSLIGENQLGRLVSLIGENQLGRLVSQKGFTDKIDPTDRLVSQRVKNSLGD